MRVCDKCSSMERSSITLEIPIDGTSFDLCMKHKDELYEWLCTQDGRKKLNKRKSKK